MISIVIPTYNRAKSLKKTLYSIEIQNTECLFEVIVIDNGSYDSTKSICDSFKEKINNLVYAYDDEPGLLTGRHLGAKMAQGNILCFIDDDVELSPNWLEAIDESFKENPGIHLATGPSIPKYESAPPYWLDYFWISIEEGKYCEWLSLLDFGTQQRIIDCNFVWGLNFAIRKNVFLELGGFHPDCIPSHLQQFQGDGETGLTEKAKKKGYKALYNPKIKLHHLVEKNRLNEAYFKKRAFYKGICISYTELRQSSKKTTNIKVYWIDKIMSLYQFIRKIIINKDPKIPKKISAMISRFKKNERMGYRFHQKHFNKNKHVRDWVLKDDYWNYKLPI